MNRNLQWKEKKRKNDKKGRLTFILFRLDQTETPKFKKKLIKNVGV